MYTYDDLHCYQDILKNLMKDAEPNLYSCHIWSSNDYCDSLYNDYPSAKQIAYIFLGVRDKPGNFTARNAAAIYSDGYVKSACLTAKQLRNMYTWLDAINPQQKRHDDRISKIKDELLAVCYHPDNVKKLIPFSR
jgi:hypothetical protein